MREEEITTCGSAVPGANKRQRCFSPFVFHLSSFVPRWAASRGWQDSRGIGGQGSAVYARKLLTKQPKNQPTNQRAQRIDPFIIRPSSFISRSKARRKSRRGMRKTALDQLTGRKQANACKTAGDDYASTYAACSSDSGHGRGAGSPCLFPGLNTDTFLGVLLCKGMP